METKRYILLLVLIIAIGFTNGTALRRHTAQRSQAALKTDTEKKQCGDYISPPEVDKKVKQKEKNTLEEKK